MAAHVMQMTRNEPVGSSTDVDTFVPVSLIKNATKIPKKVIMDTFNIDTSILESLKYAETIHIPLKSTVFNNITKDYVFPGRKDFAKYFVEKSITDQYEDVLKLERDASNMITADMLDLDCTMTIDAFTLDADINETQYQVLADLLSDNNIKLEIGSNNQLEALLWLCCAQPDKKTLEKNLLIEVILRRSKDVVSKQIALCILLNYNWIYSNETNERDDMKSVEHFLKHAQLPYIPAGVCFIPCPPGELESLLIH